MTQSPQPVLALDIGGTQIAAAAVDDGGRVVSSTRVALPNSLARTQPLPEEGAHSAADPAEADPEVVWSALTGAIARISEDLAQDSHYGSLLADVLE